jgi:hypothetical protein
MAILGPLNPMQLAGAARNALASVTQRVRPDHRTIANRSVLFPGTSMLRFYLYAAGAPSRFAARAFDDGQVRRAAVFAADAFPGVFQDTPSHADRTVTAFSISSDGAQERALYVHPSGLVELLWALSPEHPEEDELLLDTEELAAVVVHLARAVGRPAYAELSHAGRGRRRFARVDWWFNLAVDISATEGDRAWTGFKFTAASPPRARNRLPSLSAVGYGSESLRSRRRKRSPAELARVLLGEILSANGYYEFGAAADDAVQRALVLTDLPAPPTFQDTQHADPSAEQRRVLNAVHEHLREGGRRPTFRELDKLLDLDGLALRPLAESMPAGLLLPVVASRGGMFRDEDELMVTREGLRYCEHGAEELDLLARSVAYLAKREKPFVPSDAQRELKVTSDELGPALGLTATELQQVRLMLQEYEWQASTSAGSQDRGPWWVTVACEYVRRFRGVRDGDQYLRALSGESFAGQLEADEALARFALIGETPSSSGLDGHPILLRVENHGPSETFEAAVVEITNAPHAPTPWHVRWRGETQQGKEILGGGHWVLEIARDDSLHGLKENAPTPGFLFPQPGDRELFLAQTGPSVVGARYGLPLRVRIRVTPRAQPQRSLETVVTLQISERGLGVLWDRLRVVSE